MQSLQLKEPKPFGFERGSSSSFLNGFGSYNCKDCIPDNLNNAKSIRELYEKSNDTLGKYSVPVLWDKKEGVIVNNESADIIRMFSSAFNKFSTNHDLDIYPENLKKQIDDTNAWVYDNINNGVYKCGFATTQEAYEIAFKNLFEHLERAEEILSKSRYLCGNKLTEADIRFFVTVIRFDEVYVVYFKTNKKRIIDYPSILNYCREIYQMSGVAETVNMRHIKTHYYTSHPKLNHFGVIPVGPNFIGELEKAHDREKLKE